MGISKNFVIKHGLEVSTNLIFADAVAKKVGISSLSPQYTLDVAGGIGATHSYITGFSTVFTEFNIGVGGTTLTGVGGSIGIGTANPAYLLDVRSPVSTGTTALYVQGDVYITGDLTADDLTFDSANLNNLYVANAIDLSGSLYVAGLSTFLSFVDINNSVDISNNLQVSGLSTFSNFVDINNSVDILNNLQVAGVSTLATLGVTGTSTSRNLLVTGVSTISTLGVTGTSTATNLQVTGVSTLGTVKISSGIVTATSGIVTYYGDGQYLNLSTNPSSGIGIGTTGGVVGYGVTFLDLKGTGVSTSFYNSNVGIATIFFEGGGSGTIGIGTVFPTTFAGNGDLFYNINYGRIFVYYDEVALGIGSTAVWVDAAPFNVGIITSLIGVGIATEGGIVGTGATLFDFRGPGISTVTVSAGIATVNIVGGSSAIAISTNTANQNQYITYAISTGSTTGLGITTSGLTFNPSTGNMVVSGTITANSDQKLKTNIKTIENALEKVSSLRGVEYDRIDNNEHQIGVIAQEVEEIVPYVVYGDETKSVAYGNMVGLLIEAIKDLKVEVENLKLRKIS